MDACEGDSGGPLTLKVIVLKNLKSVQVNFSATRELMGDGNLWELQAGALAVGRGEIIIIIILAKLDLNLFKIISGIGQECTLGSLSFYHGYNE